MNERRYDPLSIDELGKNAARALMSYPAAALPPDESIVGPGVYVLHYTGSSRVYAGMSAEEPIYVGKADPSGRRQGRMRHESTGRPLQNRLVRHARSVQDARNLKPRDFRCRWLVLDPVWIGLTEQVLIAEYQPLWNVVVAGFGINAPGAGRGQQARSQWDTLHPGRPEVKHLPDRTEDARVIRRAIAGHLAERRG